MLWKVLLILCSVMIVIAFIGCKKEGPAEKAGRQIDKAVEKTGDKLEEAGNKVKDATKNNGSHEGILDKPTENRRILEWGDISPNEAATPALQLCEVIDNLHYYNKIRIGMPVA